MKIKGQELFCPFFINKMEKTKEKEIKRKPNERKEKAKDEITTSISYIHNYHNTNSNCFRTIYAPRNKDNSKTNRI